MQYDDGNVQIVSTQNFDFMFTPRSGGNPVSLVGTWVLVDENISMKELSEKLILSLDANGTIVSVRRKPLRYTSKGGGC